MSLPFYSSLFFRLSNFILLNHQMFFAIINRCMIPFTSSCSLERLSEFMKYSKEDVQNVQYTTNTSKLFQYSLLRYSAFGVRWTAEYWFFWGLWVTLSRIRVSHVQQVFVTWPNWHHMTASTWISVMVFSLTANTTLHSHSGSFKI